MLSSLSTGRHIPGHQSRCSGGLTLDLSHSWAAELFRQIPGGGVIQRQRGLQAEVMTARHHPAAAEVVVKVDVTAVWTVGHAGR